MIDRLDQLNGGGSASSRGDLAIDDLAEEARGRIRSPELMRGFFTPSLPATRNVRSPPTINSVNA